MPEMVPISLLSTPFSSAGAGDVLRGQNAVVDAVHLVAHDYLELAAGLQDLDDVLGLIEGLLVRLGRVVQNEPQTCDAVGQRDDIPFAADRFHDFRGNGIVLACHKCSSYPSIPVCGSGLQHWHGINILLNLRPLIELNIMCIYKYMICQIFRTLFVDSAEFRSLSRVPWRCEGKPEWICENFFEYLFQIPLLSAGHYGMMKTV